MSFFSSTIFTDLMCLVIATALFFIFLSHHPGIFKYAREIFSHMNSNSALLTFGATIGAAFGAIFAVLLSYTLSPPVKTADAFGEKSKSTQCEKTKETMANSPWDHR